MARKPKSIPKGYHVVTPVLSLKGAAEAIEFIKKAFGAEEKSRMLMPDGSIGHCEIKIGDSIVIVNEAQHGMPVTTGNLMLYVNDVDTVFAQAISAGGKVGMPVADMFWGDRFGSLTDPQGNRWSVATHKEDVSPEVAKERMDAWVAEQAKQPQKEAV